MRAFLTYWFLNVEHIGTKKAVFLQHNGSNNKACLPVRLLATSGKGPAPQGTGCRHWAPFLWAASWGWLVPGTLPPGGAVGAGDRERGWGVAGRSRQEGLWGVEPQRWEVFMAAGRAVCFILFRWQRRALWALSAFRCPFWGVGVPTGAMWRRGAQGSDGARPLVRATRLPRLPLAHLWVHLKDAAWQVTRWFLTHVVLGASLQKSLILKCADSTVEA